MRILALDTATEGCSAALLVDDEIQEKFQIAPRGHATLLLPWIDELMAGAELRPGMLDAIAISGGPGSFTGIRIGFSVAQGIAAGADVGLIVVSTLAALALEAHLAAPGERPRVLAALDARMGEIYVGGYDHRTVDNARQVLSDRVCEPAALVADAAGDWYGAGPAFGVYADALAPLTGLGADPTVLPRARAVARLARSALAGGASPQTAAMAQPVYLRNRVTS